MMGTSDIYIDLQEKYTKVLKLLDDSKFDPPSEPYASKYSAKEILLNMKTNLENVIKNQHALLHEELKIKALLGAVYLFLGIVSIDTEELSAGEKYLQQCQNTIENSFDTPQMIMVTLNMYNQFGILWADKEPEKSKMYLEKAEKLYFNFKRTQVPPVDLRDLCNINAEVKTIDSAKENFEKIHTLTLYYLAQISGALKDTVKSAIYCHMTLRRQLDSGDYDPIDWSLNAATLSQFFMEQNGFNHARHHLSASSYILREYEEKLNNGTQRNDAFDAEMEVFKHRSADVARCWAKYGLLLLSKSKERLLEQADEIDKEESFSSESLNFETNVTSEELRDLKFTSINTSHYEKLITDKFVLTIEDARLVFKNIQKWLQIAESYYTLEVLASDHIEIVQDQTQMYLNLLFFEDCIENQAKLHKRRIDLLENVIKKISPQYYLQYCRQIWFELAQTYGDILNIKCDKLREVESRPSSHVLAKINYLVERGIYNFKCFIDSFKEGVKKEFPVRISADFEKAFLQAYFHIAALNNRYITLDKKIQLANIEASYKAYLNVVDYCKLNHKAIESIPMEYKICEEMVTLLPAKIAKLTEE